MKLWNMLIAAFLAMAMTIAPALAQQVSDRAKPRNIIFILLDDLRFDGMGFLQPGRLHTPNIDRLAREGAYFPNAVVTTSLCSPSRATILTGLTTRNHGIVDNNDTTEDGLVYFPSQLQAAGYQTAFFGKWHMGATSDAPRPGFDKWVSFRGQGSYYPSDQTMLNVDGQVVPQRGYITDELTDYALSWLQREREPGRPFFLYLSHKAVHSDAVPARRHRGQYAATNFELPATAANTPENYEGKPMWVYNQRNSWHGIDFMYHSDRPATDYMRDYYGALSAVDDSIGRIMTYLRRNALDDETMIVFYSDNGFMFGEHGLIDKRTAYEASVRVPLVIRAPGLVPSGQINPGRVRNLDLAPTFLDVAGAAIPATYEGVSFLPLATGLLPAAQWRAPDFVYTYFWEWTFPMTPTTFAITRGDMKYITYHGIWDLEELYDLRADPQETRNLMYDAEQAETVITLREALYEALRADGARPSVPFTQRRALGVVRRWDHGPGAAPFPETWLVEPNRKDSFRDLMPRPPQALPREGR